MDGAVAEMTAPTTPIGVSTNNYGGGWFGGLGGAIDETEHVPDLVWPASIATLNRMRTDATITGILKAYTTPILKARWVIDPRGASDEAVALCADSLGIPVLGEDPNNLGPARKRGVKWISHIRMALLHLVYGHAFFEPVYEIRDGSIYLVSLQERLPSSITGINVNADGSLQSITQLGRPGDGTGMGIEIPAERLLWYVHDREGAVYAGRSMLRSCYAPWLLKIDTMRTNAIGIQRFSAGTPVMEPLPGTNPTPAQVAEAQKLASSVRVGETGGAATPGFTLRIKGIEGSLPDALPTLKYYDDQMRSGALASVMSLGTSDTGTRALGETFQDILTAGVQAIADELAETATDLCRRLVDFNFGADQPVPAITCGNLADDPRAIASLVVDLIGGGAITPGPELEAWVRDVYDLPPQPGGMVGSSQNQASSEPEETANSTDEDTEAPSSVAAAEGGADRNRGNAEALRHWFTHGAGAALIVYGTPGQFERCVKIAGKHMDTEEAKGYCALRIHEVTGKWPGAHRHVHAAEEQPTKYRELTPAEQAAGIDPAAVDAQQDDLTAEAEAILAAATAAWGATVAASIVTILGTGTVVGLAGLTLAVDGVVVNKMLDFALKAAGVGVKQVLAEARKAGGKNLPTADQVSPDADTVLDSTQLAVDFAAKSFTDAAGREAARLWTPGASPKDVADAAVQTAQDRVTPTRDTALAITAAAMGAGRTAAAQAVQDSSPDRFLPFASAVRDRNSCEPCLGNDGHEYSSMVEAAMDFPSGHYAKCLGRARCRCIIALKPAGEQR